MKKIEKTFAVTGFVGKDAEVRQLTNASVYASHWQSTAQRRTAKRTTAPQPS